MIDTAMTPARLEIAKQQVQNVCSTGQVLTLKKAATKDKMGTPITTSTLELRSFPVRYSPFDRRVINSVSWAADVAVIGYVAKKSLDDISKTTEALKREYQLVSIGGKEFTIARIENYSPFADDYLYIIIGGRA